MSRIPLSFSPVDPSALAAKLSEYPNQKMSAIVPDFESRLSRYTGSPYTVALNSGSAAIHLALKSLGVGLGDYVIAPTFTYVASVSPLLYLGAVPVLVDCEPEGWNIDPVLLERAIGACLEAGKPPKAIIVVHTYGMPARMNEILALAARYGIPVLEDAAEAIGSQYDNRFVGTLGELGVLSFNNNKIMTTYGGGAVLVKTRNTAEKILFWATHARENVSYYEHHELGFNYRMSALNAAMGLVGLNSVSKEVERRRQIFDLYNKIMSSKPGIGWQLESSLTRSNRWITCVTVEEGSMELRLRLQQENIETRPLWKPMHQQKLFSASPAYLNGVSDELFKTGICLPSGRDLEESSIEKIASFF